MYENPDDKPSLHSLLVFSGIQFLYLFFKAYLTPISNQEYVNILIYILLEYPKCIIIRSIKLTYI